MFFHERHSFVSESKLFESTVRHIIEISDDDVIIALTLKTLYPYYLTPMNNDFELH